MTAWRTTGKWCSVSWKPSGKPTTRSGVPTLTSCSMDLELDAVRPVAARTVEQHVAVGDQVRPLVAAEEEAARSGQGLGAEEGADAGGRQRQGLDHGGRGCIGPAPPRAAAGPWRGTVRRLGPKPLRWSPALPTQRFSQPARVPPSLARPAPSELACRVLQRFLGIADLLLHFDFELLREALGLLLRIADQPNSAGGPLSAPWPPASARACRARRCGPGPSRCRGPRVCSTARSRSRRGRGSRSSR